MARIRTTQLTSHLVLLCLGVVTLIAAACTSGADDSVGFPSLAAHAIDPTFKEFYDRMGGFDVLGPPISELREIDHYRVQFTSASLMVHDSQAATEQRFFLAPLGLEFEVAEPPSSPPATGEERYREGHTIHEYFWGVYNQLQGHTGPPLTEGRYNPEKQRFEQYFANLGFFIQDSDTSRTVQLMDYGAFKCDRYCRFRSHPSAVPSLLGVVSEPFASLVSRLGTEFTGRALTDPYPAEDGLTEIIFDNLVLFFDSAASNQVEARPIVEALEIQPHPLMNRVDDERMDFYPIEGELGHNIPVIFTDYLAQHGSFDISGLPITEIFLYDQEENIFRQCFTNLCLDYHHAAKQDETFIRPAPLGLVYKTRFFQNSEAESAKAQDSAQTLNIKVWEESAMLPPGQPQRILAGVFRGDTPLAGIIPDLTIFLPDGTEKVFFFSATSEDGITAYELAPMYAANGTLIPYEVCVQNIDNNRLCTADEFLIWGN